ncbi:thermonuclease family protein [Desulfolithobacter sp.]
MIIRWILLFLLFPCPIFAFSAKVVGVTDGDTIKVLHNGQQVKIRLYGIDCPEKGQAYGRAAKKHTETMVAGKLVKIEPIATDRYGRTVAMVFSSGHNVSESLVSNGYAWVYRKYCKEQVCNDWHQYEKFAKDQKKGLWQNPKAMPPWEWRKNRRKRK